MNATLIGLVLVAIVVLAAIVGLLVRARRAVGPLEEPTSGVAACGEPSIEMVLSCRRRRKSMAMLLAILKSQLENLNSGLYLSMLFRTLMKASWERSSAVAVSRTMRKISVKTGRSYRRTSSRNASSRPCWASVTTSASGALVRSRNAGMRVPVTCPTSRIWATFRAHDSH